MIRNIIALVGIAMFTTGCATATRGTHEMIQVNSEPAGARVISNLPSTLKTNFNGFYGCEPTPCGINLPRKSNPVITVSKTGYTPIKFKVTSSIATSSSSLPKGTIVSGLPPGSYVQVGTPDFLKSIPTGGASIIGGVFSFGTGTLLDMTTGANKNLAPNPVTVFLSPNRTLETP